MRILLLYLLLTLCSVIYAGEADVIAVEAEAIGGDFFRVTVTVRHQDEDWDHYVKGWEILDMDGKVIGVHGLRHPHVNEQPFTRTATVIIPAHLDKVMIRAYDSVHGTGGQELMLYINRDMNNETD